MFDDPKPCPFCGGKAPIIVKDVQYPNTPNARTWYAIECNACDAIGDWDLGESGAIEKWNTRPIEDALRTENERLRAEVIDQKQWRSIEAELVRAHRQVESDPAAVELALKSGTMAMPRGLHWDTDSETELRHENERLRASMARIRSHVSRALAEPPHLDTGELVHVMDELDAFEQNA